MSVDLDMDTIPNTRQRDAVLRPMLAPPPEVVASTSEQDQQIVSILTALIVDWLRDPQPARLLTPIPAATHRPEGPLGG